MQIIYMILYMLGLGSTKIGITSNIINMYYNFENNWTFLAIYNITSTTETVYSNLDYPYDYHLQHQLDYNWYQDVQPLSAQKFLEKNHSVRQIKELIKQLIYYTKKQLIYQHINSIHDFNHHFNLTYELQIA